MFYLIEFNNIESEATQQLKFELAGIPNGTILSHAQHIRVTKLPSNKWIVWINKDNVFEYDRQYEDFINIPGIKSFIELNNIQQNPNNKDWLWDDDYINGVFNNYIEH